MYFPQTLGGPGLGYRGHGAGQTLPLGLRGRRHCRVHDDPHGVAFPLRDDGPHRR